MGFSWISLPKEASMILWLEVSLQIISQEDPVCGSGHCHVIPLWANKLAQAEFRAYQASERSGILLCRIEGDRLPWKAALYSRGEIYVMD